MFAAILIAAVIGTVVVPAFVLGSIKAGAHPLTRTFWAS